MFCEELEEMDAARDARHWGAIEMTGTLWPQDEGGGLLSRTFRTSAWDCMVMRIDSAEVMQPLWT